MTDIIIFPDAQTFSCLLAKQLDKDQCGVVEDYPRPDRLVKCNPKRLTLPVYELANQAFSAGIWACDVGAWRIEFAANKQEYFFVVSGHVRLHRFDQTFVDVMAGQAAIIPPSFQGVFEVIEPVCKHYVITISSDAV